jgi:hypothetical protein
MVTLSTRLIRQLQAEKGQNTVAIPSSGALSEVVKWEFQGDENLRVKDKDGSCKLLEEVVNTVCYFFVASTESDFQNSHKGTLLFALPFEK